MWANQYEHKQVFMGRLDYEGDLLEEINTFCEIQKISTGFVSIIGALKKASLGFYNQQEKKYQAYAINEPVEIVSCQGNISVKDGKPFAHLHLIVSNKDGKTAAGHTMPGCIIFAGEAYIQSVFGPQLFRGYDETTGLPLWERD
jgi:predicted DNA-binding protein with PD1-like motif